MTRNLMSWHGSSFSTTRGSLLVTHLSALILSSWYQPFAASRLELR